MPVPTKGPEGKGIITYLDSLRLTTALWWFIENIDQHHPHRNEVFFYLRDRVRRQPTYV